MKRSIAFKWAAALDSGEYKQTTGQLRTKQGNMCCLGVLCNIHAQAHPKIAAKEKKVTVYMGTSSLPPEEVIEWAGMGSDDGHLNTVIFVNNEGYRELVSLNDDAKLTFPEIAKVIRTHWKDL